MNPVMARKNLLPDDPMEFSVAEAFILLTQVWPVQVDPLIAASDADFGLVGAILIDLSLAGCVDSDHQNLTILNACASPDSAQGRALRTLRGLGKRIPLEIALNALADRVGDLRAACLSGLAARKIVLTDSSKLLWDFWQTAITPTQFPEVTRLRHSLRTLIESDDLPHPEQAAIIALLHNCDIIGPVLGGKSFQYWLLAYTARIDAIRSMELVGRALVQAVTGMRLLLRTYLLDVEEDQSAGDQETDASNAPSNTPSRGATTWEWRAFWPEGEIVELPASWVEISKNAIVKEEIDEDRYLFVYGKKDNIKIRGKELKIKPVLEAFDEFIAFGSSAKFVFPEKALALSLYFPRLFEVRHKIRSSDELLQVMAVTGYQPSQLTVSKIRKGLNMMFGVQVEIARIWVMDQVFHSISLESPYLTPLRILARNIPVGKGQAVGYSEFLEHLQRPH